MSQSFHTIDRFRLEVEDDPTGLVNLLANPSGELGGWGWVTPVTNSAMTGLAPNRLRFKWSLLPAGQPMHFKSEFMSVAAGQYVAASWYCHSGSSALGYRARFEWYNSAKTLLSSSAQSAWMNAIGDGTLAPVQAPTNTAFAVIRFDWYANASNGAPEASAEKTFSRMTVATSATATDLGSVRRNLITNPSFETNITGWTGTNLVSSVTPTRVSGGPNGSWCGRVYDNGNNSAGAYPNVTLYSPSVSVVAGHAYQASAGVYSGSGAPELRLQWYNATGGLITTQKGYPTSGGWERINISGTAPAGAVTARLVGYSGQAGAAWNDIYIDAAMIEESATAGAYFDGTTPAAGGWAYSWTGTAHASASLASTSNLQYAAPVQYRDITGPTVEASIDREALNTGALTAVIRDALLDPSRDDLIRPGRKVRASALGNSGAWAPLFTGTMGKADVTYTLKDPSVPESKRARIEIVAHDAQAELANQERPQGVATIPELAFVLEGCGVPWSINGSGNQVPTATVVTDSPGQTAVDQIAVTRDSKHGLAWIDRRGILQAWDRASLPASPVATLSESEYTGFDATWSSEDCINEVNIALRRLNLANPGETVEVPYGPYRDAGSVKTWGARSATFTVQGIPDNAGAASAFANAVLAANATPQRRVNQLSYAVQDASGFAAAGSATAFRELCDLVRVKNDHIGFDRNLRVKSIKHKITSGKWMVELGFGEPGSVEVPTLVPPVQSVPIAAVPTLARAGTVAIPAGSGAYTVTVTGLGLPSANYVVTQTPNSPKLSGICTYSYTNDGFTIAVTRATNTAASAVRWILALI